MKKEEVVGEALEGRSEKSKHRHPVVLTGRFKKEESREPEHKKRKEGKRR